MCVFSSLRGIFVKSFSQVGGRQFFFGLCAAVVIAAPLLGRSIFIPGQLIAAVAFLVASGLFLASQKDYPPSWRTASAYALIAIYLALVVQSADARQWSLLLHPGQWSGHERDYVGFKLVVFLVNAGPPIATGIMFSLLAERNHAFRGLAVGLLAVTLIGAAVLIAASDGLYRSSYDVAADWYNGKGRVQFSIISMGILLILGGLASLFWISHRRRINLLIAAFVGLCLLGTIMLIRRMDTVLFVFSIALVIATIYRQTRVWQALVPMLAIAIIPAMTWPMVANEFSISYWRHMAGGLQYRVTAAQTTINLSEQPYQQRKLEAAAESSAAIRKIERGRQSANSRPWILGNGLGYYAKKSNDDLKYPHNLFLETYLESGPLATFVLSALLILLLAPSAWRLLSGTISRYELLGAGAAAMLLFASMKAGDITSVGAILFFAFAGNSAAVRHSPISTHPLS